MDREHIQVLAQRLETGDVLNDEESFTVAKLLRSAIRGDTGLVVCGCSNDRAADGLPKQITVCPKPGADVLGVYVRMG